MSAMPPLVRRAWWTVRHSLVAVGALAITIGATIATFSIVNGAVFRSEGIRGIDRIVTVETVRSGGLLDGSGFTPSRLATLRARAPRLLDSWVGVSGDLGTLSTDTLLEPVVVEDVSGPYFDLFGVRPVLGRLLNAADSLPDSACCAAVVSERLWRHAFGADPGIVGTSVHILSRTFVVAGVAPESFRGVRLPQLIAADIWIPAAPPPGGPPAMGVFARLTPGASFSSAQQEIETLGRALDPNDPSVRVELRSAWRGMVPPPLVVIGSAVAAAAGVLCVAVVLLGGATAVTLSRARFLGRRREFAIRMALGAEKAHLTRQAVADALAVTMPAAVVGSGLAVIGIRLSSTLQLMPAAGAFVPRIDVAPDARVWAFAAVAALVLTVLLARAEVEAMWTDPSAVSGGGLGASGVAGSAERRPVGAWQLGVATALLIVAGLFLQASASRIQREAAFPTDHAVVARLQFNARDGAAGNRPTELLAAAPPGMQFGLATELPVPDATGITRAGVAYGAKGVSALTHEVGVSPGLLDVLSLPVVAGSSLPATPDAHSDAAVIDETLARALWPRGSAVGHRLWLAGSEESLRVVGVVRAPAVQAGPEDLRRFVFVPIATRRPTEFAVVLKGPESDGALADSVRRVVRDAAPSAQLLDLQVLREYANPYAKVARAAMWPTLMVAGLAVVMALAGLFAVVNHDVVSRLREFAVRRALGAPRTRIYSQVLTESVGLVARGTAIGAVAAIPFSLLLPRQMLFAIRPADVAWLSLIPVGAFVVAVLAMLPAAFRAAQSDPLVAMRAD
jgi:predicted permease